MEDTQQDPLAVHCFCVCSGSALLGDLLGVSRSRERDLLSVLLIYPRIFLCVFIVYRLLVGFLFVWLYSAICSCVLVVLVCQYNCQMIGYRKTPTPSWGEEIISTKPRRKRVFVCMYFSFVWFVYVAMCSPGTTQYIFQSPMARYSLFVLKVPLNTNKTNKQ